MTNAESAAATYAYYVEHGLPIEGFVRRFGRRAHLAVTRRRGNR